MCAADGQRGIRELLQDTFGRSRHLLCQSDQSAVLRRIVGRARWSAAQLSRRDNGCQIRCGKAKMPFPSFVSVNKPGHNVTSDLIPFLREQPGVPLFNTIGDKGPPRAVLVFQNCHRWQLKVFQSLMSINSTKLRFR